MSSAEIGGASLTGIKFKKSGFGGPINWNRNIDPNWEVTPFLDRAKILQPTLFVTGSLDGIPKNGLNHSHARCGGLIAALEEPVPD
jgi:hypothetical protein